MPKRLPHNPKCPDYLNEEQPDLRVGVCQVYTEQWDIDGNTERAVAAITEAGRRGAEMVITPECVISGYAFPETDDPAVAARQVARVSEPIDGPHVMQLRRAVREAGAYGVIGIPELAAGGGETNEPPIIYNTALLVGPDGEVIDLYRKVHCRDFESVWGRGPFTPGDRFFARELPFSAGRFSIGPMICFDREFPETVRCLRALGAIFIPCPLATNTERIGTHTDYAHDEMITQVRAAENEVFIAVVNHAGRCNGGTFIVGPGGELITQLGEDTEVRVVPIPLGAASSRFRSRPYSWKGWAFRRQSLYDRYLGEQ